MSPKEVLKNTIEMGNMILTTYVSDMSDKEIMERPGPGTNHVAWQLGHLIGSEHKMLTDAGFKAPPLPDGFTEAHSPEACKSDAPAKFCKKGEYKDLMDKQREATLAALDSLSDADLARPSPEAMRAYAPTIMAVFNLIGIHLVMHAAQWVPLRRRLGKPILI